MTQNNSNKSSTTSKSDGISFVGLLAIAFIVLKLCNVITWSWLWVLSPIWISVALVIIGCIILAICETVSESRKNKW